MLQLGGHRLHHSAQIHLLTAIYIRLKYTETLEMVAPLRKQMTPPHASAWWDRSLAQFSNELFHVFVLELFAYFKMLDFCISCVPDNFLNLSFDHSNCYSCQNNPSSFMTSEFLITHSCIYSFNKFCWDSAMHQVFFWVLRDWTKKIWKKYPHKV